MLASHSFQAHARRSARLWPALALALVLSPAKAAAPADIEVVDAQGEVRVTQLGAERAARPGTTLMLPSVLATGLDGSADLRQGATSMGVGPNTRLEFPAPAQPGAASERVVQPRGTAFYTVAGRSARLRVETPYLVAVIKGTQFNVVVESEASTISLFEGSLEVRATEGDAVVQLAAGEVATRRRGEDGIRVIRMKDGAAAVVKGLGGRSDRDDGGTAARPAPIDVSGGGAVGVEVGLDPDGTLRALDPVEGKVSAGIALQGLSQAEVEAGAGLSLGGASGEAGVSAGADLAAGTVDAGVQAATELGAIDAGLDAGVSVDAAAGAVDAALDAGADGGAVAADLGLDAGVGAGAADLGVDLGVAGVDAGVDIGVDLGGSDPGLDLGLDLPGSGLDLDPGLGGGESGTTESENTGLLGNLRGRPGL